MADDAKAEEMIGPLRDNFARQIRTAMAELPPHIALQLADSLCAVQLDVLAGMRVTYRSKPVLDADAIIEDWRRGASLGEIMGKYKISRTTAYKFHPNKAVLKRRGRHAVASN